MPFDALSVAAVVAEVRAATEGGRIQRILQPSAAAVALAIYHGGVQHWLVLSADARFARIQLAPEKLAKGFATPGGFVMILRKYLDGARLHRAEQLPHERVVVLTAGDASAPVRLIAEVMGKHSNVILIDGEDVVLGAVKMVTTAQSRVRPIQPGRPYLPPPVRGRDVVLFSPGERIDPARHAEALTAALAGAPDATPARAALLGILPGCGPFLADQICQRVGCEPHDPLGAVDVQSLTEAAAALYSLPETGEWQPFVFQDARGRLDFAPFAPRGVASAEPVASMSAAIQTALGAEENRDPLHAERKRLLDEVQRARVGAERKLQSLWSGLEASERAEAVKLQGQLLLAYAWSLEPGAEVLDIPELETTIALDPRTTPVENADRLFRRYRKLRDAATRIPGLIEQAEHDVQRAADLEVFVRLAASDGDLRDLRLQLNPDGAATASTKARPARRGPHRFRLGEFTAMVGRNARENDEVTFRLAARDDLWLHARGRTGAHVVLQGAGPVPDETLEAAAALAAYFSAGRDDSAVDVDIAVARDIRKVPGGPPGRVTYRNSRTLRVAPTQSGWEVVTKR